jgi:hypothetical protein
MLQLENSMMLLLCTLLVQLIADKSFISIVKDGKRKIHRKQPDSHSQYPGVRLRERNV